MQNSVATAEEEEVGLYDQSGMASIRKRGVIVSKQQLETDVNAQSVFDPKQTPIFFRIVITISLVLFAVAFLGQWTQKEDKSIITRFEDLNQPEVPKEVHENIIHQRKLKHDCEFRKQESEKIKPTRYSALYKSTSDIYKLVPPSGFIDLVKKNERHGSLHNNLNIVTRTSHRQSQLRLSSLSQKPQRSKNAPEEEEEKEGLSFENPLTQTHLPSMVANKRTQATLETERDGANLPTEPDHLFTERKPFTDDDGHEPLQLLQVLLDLKKAAKKDNDTVVVERDPEPTKDCVDSGHKLF